MIWFTADEHYGHENARTGWGDPAKARPFDSLEEMTEGLIERHNAVVGRGDHVHHLGDMFWRTLTDAQVMDILRRLNGRHWYVRGNHEEVLDRSFQVRSCFGSMPDRRELRSRDYPLVVLDHYAGRAWNGSHRGSWQLHGHSHGALPDAGLLQMDVGVDCNGYAPVSLERVAEAMRAKGGKL